MPLDLPLRCACGGLAGRLRDVTPARGNRVLCYCDDCQLFAHFLGDPAHILDAAGGTDIFQTSPARVELAPGSARLACMRLRPNGLLRWYASCCRTPVGNTLATPQLPFVGLILRCVDPALDARTREVGLGPVRGRGHTKFSRSPDLRDSGLLRVLARVGRLVLGARLRGDHRRSPFFDARSGLPSATPQVLAAAELAALQRAREGHPERSPAQMA